MRLAAGTLPAICTCARAPLPPIPRTATYRCVQLSKTAGGSLLAAEYTGAEPGDLSPAVRAVWQWCVRGIAVTRVGWQGSG